MPVELEQVVEALCAVDLRAFEQAALQTEALRLRAAAGRLLGRLDQVLAELDARGAVRTDAGSQSLAGWWRDAATITGQASGRDVRRAATLRALPVIGEAVVDGRLSPEQGAILCRLHGRIPLEALLPSQAQLVDVARDLNPDALAQLVRHLIATHCEPELDKEQGRARERRHLQLVTEPDGTVRGRFVLAAEDAEAVLTVLEPLARRQGLEDSRSAGQRRADALVEVFEGAATWMELPTAGGGRPQVTYVLGASWCAGEEPFSLPEQLRRYGGHPAAYATHGAAGAWTGPQTRARMEAMLCDARVTRLLLDPNGQVLSLESLTGQVTAAQRKAVSARDRCCVVKGCSRPPAFCDVHHLDHREDGGLTVIENLVLLCRRHHVLWHRGTVGLHDLYVPWLPAPEPQEQGHDPWDDRSPPLVA